MLLGNRDDESLGFASNPIGHYHDNTNNMSLNVQIKLNYFLLVSIDWLFPVDSPS